MGATEEPGRYVDNVGKKTMTSLRPPVRRTRTGEIGTRDICITVLLTLADVVVYVTKNIRWGHYSKHPELN